MKRLPVLLSLLAAIALPLAALAQSAVPLQITYQGRVTDALGNPLGATAPINRTVTFRIWNHPSAAAGTNRLYSESQNVTIVNGEFSVLVGTGSAVTTETNLRTLDAIFDGSERYLGVTVDDGTAAVDPELSPRQQIVTTAFAILFGAVALALSLSFGLGNRELAGEVTREWYRQYQAERRAIDAEAAADEAEELAEETSADETAEMSEPPVTQNARPLNEHTD